MPDRDPDEIIAFMMEHYSAGELASLGRQALRFFFPPLAGRIEVAPGPPPSPSGEAEGGVDHPATAVCNRLLLAKKVLCSDLPQLNDPELRREVDARLRSLNIVVGRVKGWWRLFWFDELPAMYGPAEPGLASTAGGWDNGQKPAPGAGFLVDSTNPPSHQLFSLSLQERAGVRVPGAGP